MTNQIVIKILFNIVDVEVDDEYTYNGYFRNRYEVDRFVAENEEVGNTVTVLGEEYIDADKVDFNSVCFPEG